MEKKLNDAAKAYGSMAKQTWGIDKKKAADFSKGAQKPGSMNLNSVGDKLSRAWKELKK